MPQDFTTEDAVIFAGIEAGPESSEGLEFAFYCVVNSAEGHRGVWLPAVASNPQVIEQLKRMELGKMFRIASEETWGAMGTRVNAIEVSPDAPVYDIPVPAPTFLEI